MNINDLVTEIMNDTSKRVAQSYKDKGLRASGAFEKSLRVEVSQSGGRVTGSLFGNNYIYWLQHGRGPNKDQTRSMVGFLGRILTKWVEQKGISVNPYAAAYKIVHEGIKVPNSFNPGGVISDVINDQWKSDIMKRFTGYSTQVKSDVLKMFR